MSTSAPPPPLPWPPDASIGRKCLIFLKISPFTALLIYTVVSLAAKENYPLSNYPMYSNPSPERPYYTVADGNGKPLPIQERTGITCPKIGKIYRTKAGAEAEKLTKKLRADYDKELNKRSWISRTWTKLFHSKPSQDPNKLSPEHVQVVGMEIFAQLRHEAEKLKQPMPERLQLVKTYISYENGKVVETQNVIAEEPAASSKVP
jgi:hypothetical protein